MMEPTTLDALLATSGAWLLPRGLKLTVSPAWVVPGEDRLSYASLIRLCECCREYHWRRDVIIHEPRLDSIVVQCTANFKSPILVGSNIEVRYAVTRVGDHSYDCTVAIAPLDVGRGAPHALIVLTSAFYDSTKRRAVQPPPVVADALRAMIEPGADDATG